MEKITRMSDKQLMAKMNYDFCHDLFWIHIHLHIYMHTPSLYIYIKIYSHFPHILLGVYNAISKFSYEEAGSVNLSKSDPIM